MKKIRAVLFILLSVCLLIAAGCGNQQQEAAQKSSASSAKDEAAVAENSSLPSGFTGEGEKQESESEGVKRKIIKYATLNLNVAQLEPSMEKLQKLIDQSGGYVESSTASGSDPSHRQAHYVIRVPEKNFVSILGQLGQLGKTTFISQKGDDVTQQFYDNEARIKNLSSQEEAVRNLLEKAKEMEDILKIQQELFRIRGEIEALQGQNRVLDNQSSMSTIEVTLQETKASEVAEGSPWGKAKAGFIDSIEGVYIFAIDLIVFLISYSPYILVILALTGIALRLYLRKRSGENKDA